MKKGWIVSVLEKQLELAKNREEEHLMQIKCQSEQIGRLSLEVASLSQSIQSLEKALLEKDQFTQALSSKNHSLKRMLSPKSEKITPDSPFGKKSPSKGQVEKPSMTKESPVAKKTCQSPGKTTPEDTTPEDTTPRETTPGDTTQLQTSPAQCVDKSDAPTAKKRGNNGAKRKEYFTLETQEHDIWPELEGFDPSLTKVLKTVECIRYQFVPGRFIKHIYRQHQCMEQGSLHAGKLPITPLLNSNFDASALAGILQLRYIYSMPVERIIKFFTENGFDLCKPTAHGLIMKSAIMFEKVEEILRAAILKDSYINMDETYHTVLEQSEKSTSGKKSCKAYVWAALGRQSNLVQFFYDKGSRARKMLTDYVPPNYQGAIQSDGLANYKILETQSYPDTIRLSCFQHCKRGFMKLEKNRDAQRIVRIINKLYQKEHRAKKDWTSEQKLQYRQNYAPPILNELKQALLEIQSRNTTLPKSELSKAVNYTLNEYDSLCNYIKQPHYDLDNNAIERVNRYISLSRKNSLFCGSHKGAKRSALIYSLACSCRLNNINTFEYFKDILMKLTKDNISQEELRNLLPDKWNK